MTLLTFKVRLGHFIASRSIGRKETTRAFYAFVERKIVQHWHNLECLVEAITPDDVLSFAKVVADCSASYWNTIVSALQFITPHGKLLKRRAMKIREFTPPGQSQFSALLAECDALERSQAGLVVRFLSLTGMRITEACKLRWENIASDRIDVPGAITKSGQRRSIPYLPGLGDVLARLRTVGDGIHVLPPGSVRKGIAVACERAGLPRLSPHCFRHLFATRCLESGVDVPTVARWMGHQDGGALLSKTYFHLVDEHSRTMAAKVNIPA